MWSRASCSGNIAGCSYATESFVTFHLPTWYSQMFLRTPNFRTDLFVLFFTDDLATSFPSGFRCVPVIRFPCLLFGLSLIRLAVFGFPLDRTNIYSNEG